MCKTGTEGEEMLGKKSLVQSTTQERPPCWGASCLQEKEARFAAQATMTALLRFTTQWRQHAEVRSNLHLVRSFTGEPTPGKGLQGFRTERSSAFPRLSGFTSVSSWPLYSDTCHRLTEKMATTSHSVAQRCISYPLVILPLLPFLFCVK